MTALSPRENTQHGNHPGGHAVYLTAQQLDACDAKAALEHQRKDAQGIMNRFRHEMADYLASTGLPGDAQEAALSALEDGMSDLISDILPRFDAAISDIEEG